MIKALIFDIDGVLINSEKLSKKFAREYNIPLKDILPFFDGPFNDCILGKADLKEAITPYLRSWGWKKGVDKFLDYWFSVEHIMNQELIDCIQNYRKEGIKCFVATNQEKHRAEYIFNKMGFADSFDKFYFSSNLGHKKPDSDFFAKVVNDLGGIRKEEILFWDDAPENIAGAKEFGINAELFTSFPDFKRRIKVYSL